MDWRRREGEEGASDCSVSSCSALLPSIDFILPAEGGRDGEGERRGAEMTVQRRSSECASQRDLYVYLKVE